MIIREFNKINKNDVALAGGKGASLGEMTQAGIPIPEGYVILSEAFERFIKETELTAEIDACLDSVNHEEIHTVENASEKIRALIMEKQIPKDISKDIIKEFNKLGAKFIAVRSSATSEDSSTAAWAGQLGSYLNTTKDSLLENVKKCWASLFTPRAIFYRFEKKLHKEKVSVAVVVQKMVQSEVSGIAFSVHPVTQDRNQLIIEAGFGLGEAIVSGQITPDSYVVLKDSLEILDKNVSEQIRGLYKKETGGNEWIDIGEKGKEQVLTEEEITELSKLIIKIEKHYGFPVDVEWAREKGKFYIVQSRPITTLTNEDEKNEATKKNYQSSDWYHYGRWIEPVLTTALWMGNDMKDLDFNTLNTYYVLKGNYFFLKSELKKVEEFVEDKINNDKSWFDKLFLICEERAKKIISFQGKKDINGLLISGRDCLNASMTIQLIDYGLERYLEKISKKTGITVPEVVLLIKPFKKTLLMEFQEELRKSKNEDIPHLVKKYEWIRTQMLSGKALNEDTIKEEIKNISNNEKPDKLINLPNEYNEILRIGSKLAYYRTYLVELFNKTSYYYIPLIKKLATKYKLKWEEVLLFTFEELIQLNNTGKIPIDFKKRKNGFGIIRENNKFRVVIEDELNSLLKSCQENLDTMVSELKGMVAYKGGIINGVTRIIENANDIHKLKKGEILVTNETTPDFVIGMKIAGAIITNQGGLTTHASIVSRELRIPCIIGTKIATQVLHDGDLVEVDTDKGIIQVLERAKESLFEDPSFINGEKWNISVTRNMSFWHQFLSNQGHFHHMKDFGIKPLRLLTVTNNSTETHAFLNPENNKEYSQSVLETISSNQGIDKLKQNYFKYSKELLKSLEICDKNLNFNNWNKFISSYRKLCAGLYITVTIGRNGSELLSQELKNYFLEEEIPEIISLITYPEEHTSLFNSLKELLSIGKEIQEGTLKQKNIDNRLKKWIEKYSSIPVNFCEEPWTIKDVKQHLNTLLEKNCKEEIKLMKEGNEVRLKKAKEILKKVNNKKVTILANAIAEGTYLNEYRKNVFSRVSLGYRKIFQKIIKKTGGNNWRDGFYLTPEEMGEILKGKKFNLNKIKQERKEIGMYIDKEGNLKFLNNKELQGLELFLLDLHGKKKNEEQEIVSEIKGFSANKGKIKGIMKVILSSKDFHKLNRDEILVTTMTSVDFIPIMEKAAAFVTNEGGITSHAAIVAREMNKPCIIGTKIATQILHDGDFVEVDADKGIVKILKRQNGK